MISHQFNANFFATGDAPYPGYMIVEIKEDVTALKTVKIPVLDVP